jgi:N-acetyl-1-D-myo-inositol-2-amino-2-deoxy-alpha-D-glucopyranoside deacetylase
MSDKKKLVFFGAHPDDESFGMGATLAQYAAGGVEVYYVCSTGGELGTVVPERLKGYDSIADLRVAELTGASKILGLAGFFYLGYRDSGMRGSPDNKHPEAMTMAPLEEITGRIVKYIRQIKPDVVVTHDEGGGYGHPDHVATHKGVVKAFHAAGDPEQYHDAGPPFQPKKLYFLIHPRRMMNVLIKLMPLFGQDPHHFGRNGDVDLTRITNISYPIHAVIRLKKQYVAIRDRAVASHASQTDGRNRPLLFRVIDLTSKMQGPREYFMRAYPAPSKRKESDLFEGLE